MELEQSIINKQFYSFQMEFTRYLYSRKVSNSEIVERTVTLCMVASKVKGMNTVTLNAGWAIHHPIDEYNPAMAKHIAEGRAKNLRSRTPIAIITKLEVNTDMVRYMLFNLADDLKHHTLEWNGIYQKLNGAVRMNA